MSNKDYYQRWLKLKEQLKVALGEDERIQDMAINDLGLKPQSTAVEVVSRVYNKYCMLYNQLCDCYDQMGQVQRRPCIKLIIDAITCRLMELKSTLEEVEVFEYTYPDNALIQMLITPQDIEVMVPFFYPFEIRQAEMQYIMDQIMAGNRLGDPEPTPSELERLEEERLEAERIKQEEKEAEIKRKLAMGEDIEESVASIVYTPAQLAEIKARDDYRRHLINIQRMERSRIVIRENTRKFNKNADLMLELSGQKSPPAKETVKIAATALIQRVYRRFMEIKREHVKTHRLKHTLGLIVPSWKPPSAKIQLEKVKELRRKFRNMYQQKWIEKNLTEKARVLRFREDNIMEDISDEIREWFHEWYDNIQGFDEIPYELEGGSILIVTGQTFSIPEYIEWAIVEKKRLQEEAAAPKTKEQIKAEKAAIKAEKKKQLADAKIKLEKKMKDYKKCRLNPDQDPGVWIKVGTTFDEFKKQWDSYESAWKNLDVPIDDAHPDIIRGYIMELITEDAYQECQIKLRPIVDEMMRLELALLKKALKVDYALKEEPLPLIKKRKKPKKRKPPKKEKETPERMFQVLSDEGIIKKYPKVTLDDFWGDRNYAAADGRAIPWTPIFPRPCVGDVRELVRIRCLLTLGCSCPNAWRTQLLVGPKYSGKKTLAYAVATETNSLFMDLSPFNIFDKFPGPKNFKTMFDYVVKIAKKMQPTIIFIENVEKVFYKKVPKEEKMFDPQRMAKDMFKLLVKPIGPTDKILILGTAAEPWLAKGPMLYKVFPQVIMIPRVDYASLSFILTHILMQYHPVDRDFDVHSVAQVLKGYDLNTIRKCIEKLLSGKRLTELYYKPLQPQELVTAVLSYEGSVYIGDIEADQYKAWYDSYSPFTEKFEEYKLVLESHMKYKLKMDKKKKKAS